MWWIRCQSLGNEHQLTWSSVSQAVHKICVCHIIMTVDLPVLLENWTEFVNLQGSVKDSPIVVNCYLTFFSSLTKSVSFWSLCAKILKLKPLVDVSGSKGYNVQWWWWGEGWNYYYKTIFFELGKCSTVSILMHIHTTTRGILPHLWSRIAMGKWILFNHSSVLSYLHIWCPVLHV